MNAYGRPERFPLLTWLKGCCATPTGPVAGKADDAMPRPAPDSGNRTVRDRRGACGHASEGGHVTPPRHRKSGTGNPPPTVRAPEFYPNPSS
jgi:hypothetical protein